MKPRPDGFLREELIDHNSEQFDYIRELGGYLWRFVRVIYPGASGSLGWYIDKAIEKAERDKLISVRLLKKRMAAIFSEENDGWEAWVRLAEYISKKGE